ncbi:MAG: class I SAM-dependent methyltransferase [Clostridiales bacterium]|nr:class I SAM-dependent methyltransferase [Clostridiales bacterium]
MMTTEYIDKYVNRIVGNLDSNAVLLNAGSGGKCYNTAAKQIHLDLAENTLQYIENAVVGNIIDMPFDSETFDCVICVGTVINYCEVDKAIREINRVSKNNALLILEYERSASGLVPKHMRNTDCLMFLHTYFNEPHKNLLYSDSYIRKLMLVNGYSIKNTNKFNTTIPWMERFATERIAHRMTILEPLLRSLPFINKYSHNEIMICEKVLKSSSVSPKATSSQHMLISK